MSALGVLVRHGRAFSRAWRAESARRRTDTRKRIETAFLPAALEVVETPPSPVGRAVLWLIVLAVLSALAWAVVSEVDTVAVAEGRVVSRGRLQTVESAEGGVVRALHVREGAHVSAGDPLIELDPTFADADAETARAELAAARLARARAAALLAFADGTEAAFAPPEDADPVAAAAEAEVVRARVAAYEAAREGLVERRNAAEAAERVAEQEILLRQELLPLVRQRYEAREELARRGHAPALQVIELQEQMVSMRREIEIRQAERDEAGAQAASVSRELEEAAERFRAEAAGELAEAEAAVATRTEALRAAERRSGLQTLVSPVDGIVHEIGVTTIGEVVDAGAPLITVVPSGDELIVEALILNSDVGFVEVGMPVVVKLQAYPFTRYGYLEGVLEHVSPDAVPDERRGLVFPARVALTTSTLSRGDREARLTPGMTANAEVVTGRRRVISYLLSPIARAVGEAGRER